MRWCDVISDDVILNLEHCMVPEPDKGFTLLRDCVILS